MNPLHDGWRSGVMARRAGKHTPLPRATRAVGGSVSESLDVRRAHSIPARSAVAAVAAVWLVGAICAAAALQPGATLAAEAPLSPADFDVRLPLTASAQGGLHQLTLDDVVLRAARWPDLRDLRIFNARGESLPIAALPRAGEGARSGIRVAAVGAPAATAPAAGATATAAPSLCQGVTTVPLVVLPGDSTTREKLLADVAVRVQRPDGTSIDIDLGRAAGAAAAPAGKAALAGNTASTGTPVRSSGGYLFDLRACRGRDGELAFQFAPGAPDFAAAVQLQGSDNLVDWRNIGLGPLVRDSRFVPAVEQARFVLPTVPAFVRFVLPVEVTLSSARFEPLAAAMPPAMAQLMLPTAAVDGLPGVLQVVLPPAIPVQALVIRPTQTDTVVRLQLQVQAPARPARHRVLAPLRRPAEPGWQVLREVDVFRLTRDGVDIESSPLPFDAATDAPQRTLRIVPLSGADGFGASPPQVMVQWQPVRVAFVARGPAPFTMAVGRADPLPAAAPPMDLRPLLAADDPAGLRLPAVRLPAARPPVAQGPDRPVADAAAGASTGAASAAGQVAAAASGGAVPATSSDGLTTVTNREGDRARVLLWGVLVVAVLVVSGMAVAVWRQMRRTG